MNRRVNIHGAGKDFEKYSGIRAFSLEFELILELFYSGPMNSGEIVKRINASQASFSSISRNLRQQGIIVSTPGDIDRRMVIYSLSDETRNFLSRYAIAHD
jgi:DNA-binding MarR family transcriptional regulator